MRRLNAKLPSENNQPTPPEFEEPVEIPDTTDNTLRLHSGDHVGVDFGLYALATLSGVVFHDTNADGVYSAQEDQTLGEFVTKVSPNS